MTRTAPSSHHDDVASHTPDAVTAQVRAWLEDSRRYRVTGAAAMLADLLDREGGLAFLTQFVDEVIRPEDRRVAARSLRALSRQSEGRLAPWQRGALALGSVASRLMPGLVVGAARLTVRTLVGHLIVDATPKRLGGALARLRRDGHRLNVNLLGEAVLGQQEASRRLARTEELLSRTDVDYVSLKVSAAIAPHNPWALDESVGHIVDTLRPLLRRARSAGGFVNLDMEEYRDLDLTTAVFMELLGEEEFRSLTAGIVLQAYLPDSLPAMHRLQEWAAARVEDGGAPIKIRLVKGANLSMEKVDAEIHGWPLATWGSKAESDAQYKRLLDYALTPERTRAVRIGVAGHNLFDIAHAHLLAAERGVSDAIDFEMLLGMGEHVAKAVAKDVGSLRLYTPVVHPKEFDVALAYLVRRLEEVASKENFMSSLYRLDADPQVFAREESRFLQSWKLAAEPVVDSYRDVQRPEPGTDDAPFTNAADMDPSVASSRAWADAIRARSATSTLGVDTLAAARIESADALSDEVTAAKSAAPSWAGQGAAARAAVLRRVAQELEQRRGALVEVMMSEAGKTVDQADPEVSEAIDFARYYAERAVELEGLEGARPVPREVTVVTPPWNFPVAIPTGSTLAALATGSAVVLKPAEQSPRCGAVLAEAMWAAGVPREVLRLIDIDPEQLGDALLSDPRVDQVILTGGFETAARFLSIRPDLKLFAETSGKNAIVVTPSADLDLAVRDIVASTYGHAGQKCSAASLVIAVGSVATSHRFLTQLEDAVRSLTAGPADSASTQMGPVIEPVRGKLERALTTLEPGERWIVEPRPLDDSGRSWTPALKAGTRQGSFFHLTECFGPVLSVMAVGTLDDALQVQNAVDYGLTAGIHSLDPAEVSHWIDRVQAGNVYVNRGITGAIVQRQPFGGWKRSVVGPTFKAGGPHYLSSLVDWERTEIAQAEPRSPRLKAFLDRAQAPAWVRSAVAADEVAWEEQYGAALDRSGLACEVDALRYRPAEVDIRWDGEASTDDLIRACAAHFVTGGEGVVSAPVPLPGPLALALDELDIDLRLEDDAMCLQRASAHEGTRVRAVGRLVGNTVVSVFDHAVTASPHLELTPFLREQAVSLTAHRYGTPFEAARAIAARL
ncbi:bifunctional proline dehydrogenase/L-glutamate gamma-semialdehyde dehydrogenase [Demequina zhanjiangensis]|uniref:L-glutamate gamma-semialdehyde dehydrogenase n=1 Tax=Demequina zhanjiangensis TaxID=3051659 RepID=A0ABT8G2D7_9MICO|nr:bifunctional proline dehydrogenase/L-glutamate gamma-semialdehyde dehydrogenase [Demequina sp. SYSU T00b26]MDN4473295.1 bifunctional proline dehydrogenase/L-glutamate gamma-semialdehyde dehydrogenase [Demequina sp. SYSU T00b26]